MTDIAISKEKPQLTFANLYIQWHLFLFNLSNLPVALVNWNVNVFSTNPASIFGLSQWLLATFLWLLKFNGKYSFSVLISNSGDLNMQ